jgi:hypothetical protein
VKWRSIRFSIFSNWVGVLLSSALRQAKYSEKVLSSLSEVGIAVLT